MINMLSKKKRDTMLSSAPSGVNPPPGGIASGTSIIISPVTGTSNLFETGVHSFLFCPSQKTLTPSNATYTAQRTNTYCYYKGFAETFTFLPNDNSVWWHRRIVFSSRRRYAEENQITSGSNVLAPAASAGGVSRRKYLDMSESTGTDGFADIQALIVADVFRGTLDVDFVDPLRAKLDKSQITVHSDRLVTLKSTNDVPNPRVVKHYTPINKTVVYDDTEQGVSIQPSQYSVMGKSGIGNLYILDFFECPVPNDTTTTTLNLSSQMTAYWHEK